MAKYSETFKLQVVQEYLDGPLGYRALAKKHAIPDAATVRKWVKFFQEFGLEGLKPKQKGRPSMSRKPRKQAKSTSLSQEELERENELLRLEIAYLKKLKAFRENPDAFLEKHKQQWHTHSKKKDSN